MLQGANGKFFGTSKSFFRTFISFFRTFISRLRGEYPLSTELSVYSSVEIAIYRHREVALVAFLPTSTRINVVYLQTLQADLRNR